MPEYYFMTTTEINLVGFYLLNLAQSHRSESFQLLAVVMRSRVRRALLSEIKVPNTENCSGTRQFTKIQVNTNLYLLRQMVMSSYIN